MKLLLDLHAFLWFVDDDRKLSAAARALIEDPVNDIRLSVGSVWEMAIKVGLGIRQPVDVFVKEQVSVNRIALLNITIEHAATVATLPLHHRDPFDRLLIAQALVEQIPVVGVDGNFDACGVQRLW